MTLPGAGLPTVEALESLWREIAGKNLWLPPNTWKTLRLRATLRTALVDPDKVRVTAPPGKVNDCSTCLENCCHGARATVSLGFRDIAMLVDTGRHDLIERGDDASVPPDGAAATRHRGSLRGRRFPTLRQNAFGACLALTQAGRCGVYPHWPLSCARFPYALHSDLKTVFYSQRCDSFWVRQDAVPGVRRMVLAAVAAYNGRVQDAALLAYAPGSLEALGLLSWLRPE